MKTEAKSSGDERELARLRAIVTLQECQLADLRAQLERALKRGRILARMPRPAEYWGRS